MNMGIVPVDDDAVWVMVMVVRQRFAAGMSVVIVSLRRIGAILMMTSWEE